jgi:hypothetical protein
VQHPRRQPSSKFHSIGMEMRFLTSTRFMVLTTIYMTLTGVYNIGNNKRRGNRECWSMTGEQAVMACSSPLAYLDGCETSHHSGEFVTSVTVKRQWMKSP